MGRLKDYKPYALDALIFIGVVRVVEGGRVCLSEKKFDDLISHSSLSNLV